MNSPVSIYTDERVLRQRTLAEAYALQVIDWMESTQGRIAVDLGTGSGIIGITVAQALPTIEVWATDIRDEAIAVAQHNAHRNRVTLHCAQGDWFQALPLRLLGHIDAAIATPPYLTPEEHARVDVVEREHTPYLAMVGGNTGLEATDALAQQGAQWLKRGACLWVECLPERIEATAETVARHGYDVTINRWAALVKAILR